MTRRLALFCSTLVVALLTACAHPITLGGDVAKLVGTGGAKIDRKVGLLVTANQRNTQVVTPGGGGDKVNYQPYRDLEPGLYVALSESFTSVTKLDAASDPKIAAEALNYIVTPSITTTSSSPSLLTWPPTQFSVELSCTIADPQGKPVTEVKVLGEGRAEFDEFKADTSLSARRATDDALKKLIKAISDIAAKLR